MTAGGGSGEDDNNDDDEARLHLSDGSTGSLWYLNKN